MSMIPTSRRPLLAGLLCLALTAVASAATGGMQASIRVAEGGSVRIEGRFPSPVRSFSFLDSRAGIGGLSSRISGLKLFNGEGREVSHRQGTGGAVFADGEVSAFEYKLDLSPQDDVTLGAHVSWMSEDKAVLMPGDLLPWVDGKSAPVNLRLDLPAEMRVFAAVSQGADGAYTVEDHGEAVFLVAKDIRESRFESNGARISLAIEGEWQFSDDLAEKMAGEIFAYYEDLFDAIPARNIGVMVVRVPDPALRDRWRAETIGSTIVILSSPSTYENHGEQRIHEQLRHELLHLWIPNGLNLTGDYAWFYEGFVLYRALIAGSDLGQITFQSVLDSLNRARLISERSGEWQPLVNGSGEDSPSAGSEVVSRGMLAAFASDIALVNASKGSKDLDDVFRRVYQAAGKEKPAGSANEFIIGRLLERRELHPVVNGSIVGRTAPDWYGLIETSGLHYLPGMGSGGPSVIEDPTSRQKAILRRLGYNKRR